MRGSRLYVLMASSLVIAVAGCAAPEQAYRSQSSSYVVSPTSPPPMRVETIPPPPLSMGHYVWQSGHWSWSGSDWMWVGGRYVESY